MTRFAAAVLMVAAIASAVRLPRLDERPMHADEAILADKFGALLSGGGYPYDPREFHGSVLAYFSLVPAVLAGRTSYGALTETTLRLVPAVFGILLALSPLLLARTLGRRAAIAAAAVLAVAPPMAYYSRFYIPETLLTFWTAALLAALWLAHERPGPLPWAAAGAAAGLMLATKETAVLALAACAAAGVLASRGGRLPAQPRAGSSLVYKAAAFAAALLAVVSLLLAPPWKWPALAVAVPAYFARGVSPGGHAHPWTYYLSLAWWALPPAAIGLAEALRSKRPFHRFLGYYTLLVAAIYCAIPYKTPWCVLTMLYSFALLAGIAADALARRWRTPVFIAFLAGLALLAWQAWTRGTTMAADPRNPLAYSQTGAGVFTIRERVRQVARAAPEGAATAIAVYSRQNLWPLPWYLRDYPNLLWWREVALPGRAAPIVLLSPEMEPELARKIYEGPPPGQRELYVSLFDAGVELRPGVEVRGYVAKSLWDRWQQTQ